MAQRERERAEHARPVGEADHGADLVREQAGERRLHHEHLDLVLGPGPASGTPSSQAPSPRIAVHSSPVPKSWMNPTTTSPIDGPSAIAIESANQGMPRLAFRLPSIGSTTTTGPGAVAEDALAELLRDEREVEAPERSSTRDDGGLGGGVDGGRVVAALARAQHRLALVAGRQLGDGAGHGRRGRAAQLEPGLRVDRHSSNGAISRPLVSLGKKYVLFCGMTSPARANSSTWSIVGARTRNAAVAAPARTAATASAA